MITNIQGEFYDDVILQVMRPELADVSAADYTAKKLAKTGVVDNTNGTQRPFVICHPEAVTLKVETWLGITITWKFMAGYNPMPLKRIYNDAANVITESDEAITEIQIGY